MNTIIFFEHIDNGAGQESLGLSHDVGTNDNLRLLMGELDPEFTVILLENSFLLAPSQKYRKNELLGIKIMKALSNLNGHGVIAVSQNFATMKHCATHDITAICLDAEALSEQMPGIVAANVSRQLIEVATAHSITVIETVEDLKLQLSDAKSDRKHEVLNNQRSET